MAPLKSTGCKDVAITDSIISGTSCLENKALKKNKSSEEKEAAKTRSPGLPAWPLNIYSFLVAVCGTGVGGGKPPPAERA